MGLRDLPSAQRYATALETLDQRLTAVQRALLLSLFHAPQHTSTATALGQAVGLKNWRAVNLRLGLAGSLLRDELRYRGRGQKSYVIASFLKPRKSGRSKKEWLWTMHPPLVQALRTRVAQWPSTGPQGRSFLLYGGSDADNGDYSALRRAAERRASISGWSCLKDVRKGDEVWFYVKSPVSAVVAKGIALLDARSGRHWPYETRVGGLEWIEPHISLGELRTLFPTWDWVRAARGKVHLTESRADLLRWVIKARPSEGAGITGTSSSRRDAVLEGLARESRVMRKSRSRTLRDAAMQASKGICEGCGTNYSRVLDGRAACVLQVHHRRQLALNTVPIAILPRDLAVVCANCHALIHADPQRALCVREVQSLLPAGWGAEHGA